MTTAILPSVAEHLDWVKTDTGDRWNWKTGDYFRWRSYLNIITSDFVIFIRN